MAATKRKPVRKPARKPQRKVKRSTPAPRITPGAGAKRNTRADVDAAPRITPVAARVAARVGVSPVVPMKASAQLHAFPSSANAVARQSHWKKAVVSIRLKGDVVAKLDAIADRENNGRTYNLVTRSRLIERFIGAGLASHEVAS